jgi:hypothetical protein
MLSGRQLRAKVELAASDALSGNRSIAVLRMLYTPASGGLGIFLCRVAPNLTLQRKIGHEPLQSAAGPFLNFPAFLPLRFVEWGNCDSSVLS